MPDYAIIVHRRGHDSELVLRVTEPKPEARATARRMAEHAFPDCRLRWSGDAVIAMQDGTYTGCVAVEQAEETP